MGSRMRDAPLPSHQECLDGVVRRGTRVAGGEWVAPPPPPSPTPSHPQREGEGGDSGGDTPSLLVAHGLAAEKCADSTASSSEGPSARMNSASFVPYGSSHVKSPSSVTSRSQPSKWVPCCQRSNSRHDRIDDARREKGTDRGRAGQRRWCFHHPNRGGPRPPPTTRRRTAFLLLFFGLMNLSRAASGGRGRAPSLVKHAVRLPELERHLKTVVRPGGFISRAPKWVSAG